MSHMSHINTCLHLSVVRLLCLSNWLPPSKQIKWTGPYQSQSRLSAPHHQLVSTGRCWFERYHTSSYHGYRFISHEIWGPWLWKFYLPILTLFTRFDYKGPLDLKGQFDSKCWLEMMLQWPIRFAARQIAFQQWIFVGNFCRKFVGEYEREKGKV